MTPPADRNTYRRRVAARALLALVATAANSSTRAAVPTAENVARETLLDALAPALAVRGATASVAIAPPDARRVLDVCTRMEGFMPPGSRLAGRTVVGVRCVDGASWQTFVSATVRVEAPTWQATRALRAGEPIGSGDVELAQAPLTTADIDAAASVARSGSGGARAPSARGFASLDGRLPAPVGRVALRAVAAGRPLMQADIRDEGRINPGDAVRVVYLGDGFSVSSEGHSVGSADPGSNVTIRLASGVVVNGTLRADRLVELVR